MLTMVIIAVRDRSADAYMTPFFAGSVGMAIRSFSDEVNRASPDNILNRHPEDFDLFQLGIFNVQSGEVFASEDMPRQIAIGKDCVAHSSR